MSKPKSQEILVQGTRINIVQHEEADFICLTDMARKTGGDRLIENWLRTKSTIEFLGVWETMYNPSFNSLEFEGIKASAGSNRFVISVKQWIKKTDARGIFARTGRHGSGTFAHRDIAFEFGSWISPEFKLYLIKEFQRLKEDESQRQDLDWDFRRFLSKANYRIHTDAIKDALLPSMRVPEDQEWIVYADEADLLNRAVFGMTAREWRAQTSNPKGNIRDRADIVQLTILSNLESLNATFIHQGKPKGERYKELRAIAALQYQALSQNAKLSEKMGAELFSKPGKLSLEEEPLPGNIRRSNPKKLR